MKSYHFSCGDSTHGPVGFAGSVRARTRPEALLKLRRALSQLVGPCGEVSVTLADTPLGYLNFYLTPENIRVGDFDGED